MGGGGKGAPAAPPVAPTIIPGGFTSWDGGESWQEDSNTHFTANNGAWYVEPGEDINVQSNWKPDTMAKWHKNYNPTQRAEEEAQQQEMYDSYLGMMSKQSAYIDELKATSAKNQAVRDAETASLAEKEKKRLAMAASGRKATILTSGQGVTGDAQVRKTKLGA
jgi:hypothetical protein